MEPSPAAPAASSSLSRPNVLAVVLCFVVLPAWVLLAEVEIASLQTPPQLQAVNHSELRGPKPTLLELLALGDVDVENERSARQLYPERIFEADWSEHVPRRDVLHVGALQRACVTHRESVISWEFGRAENADPWSDGLLNRTVSTDTITDEHKQKLLETLRVCPDMDIYIPRGLRGQGYCEDAAAYTKYLKARMIPHWLLEIKLFDAKRKRDVTYHELCPHTPILVFNHYWADVRQHEWPATKPLYLMPNIEMYELKAKHYRQVDVVLCKTVLCAQYLKKWFAQEGNPRMTQVLYHRFTTSDMATNALAAAGVESSDSAWHERNKTFETPTFVHTAGTSGWKGTQHVIDCWLSRPDLPQLDLYRTRGFSEAQEAMMNASHNIKLHKGYLDPVAFGAMIARTSFFLCTSIMEGYGHYINHARASGGLVISTDVPPMNELVTPASGVLVRAKRQARHGQFLGGNSTHKLSLKGVEGFAALFGGEDLCAAVDEVVTQLSVDERRRRAHRVRQQFFYDTAFFAWKMRTLRGTLLPAREAAR